MALEQHPVPQNISSYQFRLVGDMTLKQFFQLAAGAGVGLLIYGSPLPGFIKWPLVIFCVLTGAAFAFLPIQDRPLSQWLIAFFRSIYSPTIFTWDRSVAQENYFLPEDTEALAYSEQQESLSGNTAEIQAQFGEVASGFLENLENAEEKYLSKITGLFKHNSSPTEQAQQQPVHPTIVNEVAAPVPPIPAVMSPTPQPAVVPQPVPQPELGIMQQANQTLYQSAPSQTAFTPQQSGADEIFNQIAQGQPATPAPVAQTRSQILFNVEKPTQPNILVGKVRDREQNPLSNAIMEIKDEFGRPVRALRTDNEGKFRIVTPLHDGKYSLITEKDGYKFDSLQLELNNTILEPIYIEGIPE